MIRPELQELFQQYAGLTMEETSQQEKQELEYKNPNADQGGIHRRLRDRDLLKKKKAEAEEKETNQWVFGEESPRKRQRAEDKSGAKRRGRPRKSEPTVDISVPEEETAVPQEATAVLPEPAVEVIPDQASGFLESQPASLLTAPTLLKVFGSLQNPVCAPALTSSASLNETKAIIPPSVPASSAAIVFDKAPISLQDLTPATVADAVPIPLSDPDLAPTETPVPAAAPAESFYPGKQGMADLNQVLIEDVGPEEDEDISVSQEKRDDEDLSGTPSYSTPEENKIFSVSTLSSQPPPQEYLPGNSV